MSPAGSAEIIVMNSHPSELVERVRDLLEELLAPICTARKLDQLEKLNVADAAALAWRDFLKENPELEADAWWCSPEVTSALDSIVVATLDDDVMKASAAFEVPEEAGSVVLTMASMETLLGEWLSGWHRHLRAIDPLAAEIVLLRLRGFGNRAISEGLETGLRLVNRIVTDIRIERSEASAACGKEAV